MPGLLFPHSPHLFLFESRVALDHDLEWGQGQVKTIDVVLAESSQADLWCGKDMSDMWATALQSVQLIKIHTFGFLDMYPVVASRWPEINPRSVDLHRYGMPAVIIMC